MNSIERVKAAIQLKKVDRIPVFFELAGETDIKELYIGPPKNWRPKRFAPFVFDLENYAEEGYEKKEDEWGVVWGYGETLAASGIVEEYPIKSLDDIEKYQFPDPFAAGRFNNIISKIDEYDGKYCYATWYGLLFERLHYLYGFEKTLLDLVTDLDRLEILLDKVLDFQLKIIRNLGRSLKGKIQAFASTEDWGGQTNLFIDPKLWRKVFKPRYAMIGEEIHKQGLDFWLHSDGRIEEIIPDLKEVGVDVFVLCTPRLLGIKEFGQRFAGKGCYCLFIDTQKTAVDGTLEEIEKDASDLVKYWSNDYGSGVIAMDYRGNEIYQGKYDKAEIIQRKKVALSSFKKAFYEKIKN